ncbi:unnamed protein product [Linum trigynum]|uniref:Uncharacterized protein n=1 Tax=Linum trigynum TaxID=586398 RepID=A0AAV2EHD7_9ROSI
MPRSAIELTARRWTAEGLEFVDDGGFSGEIRSTDRRDCIVDRGNFLDVAVAGAFSERNLALFRRLCNSAGDC